MNITVVFPDALKSELATIADEHNFASIEDMITDWLKGLVIVDRQNKANKQAVETATILAENVMSSVTIAMKPVPIIEPVIEIIK